MHRKRWFLLAIAMTLCTFLWITLFMDDREKNLQDGIQLEGRHDQRNSVLANSRLKPSLVYKNKFNIEMSAETDKSVSVTGSTINVRKTFVKGKQTKFESVSMLTPSTRTPNFNRTDPDLAGNNTHKVGTGRQEKTRNSSEAAESAEERDCGISLRSMDVKLEWMKIREEKKVIEEDRVMIQKQRKLLEQQQMELEQGKIKLAEEIRHFKAYRERLDEMHRKSLELNQKQATYPPPRPIGDLWQGLDPHKVESKFPGIQLDGDYMLRPFVDPQDPRAMGMFGNPHSLDDMTDAQAEERFYQLLGVEHVHCSDVRRMGNIGDGGWDVCVEEPFKPHLGCLIYSFGINNDFTFDDSMSETFNCDVKSFDPSMDVDDHMHSDNVLFYNLGLGSKDNVTEKEWTIMTLSSILKKLGHTDVNIDYLKFDVEFSEWNSLQNMLLDKSLANVKQLAFEIHTAEVAHVNRQSSKADYVKWYSVLLGLEHQGFRRFHYHFNPYGRFTSVRTGRDRSCCYELYYINLKFLDPAR